MQTRNGGAPRLLQSPKRRAMATSPPNKMSSPKQQQQQQQQFSHSHHGNGNINDNNNSSSYNHTATYNSSNHYSSHVDDDDDVDDDTTAGAAVAHHADPSHGIVAAAATPTASSSYASGAQGQAHGAGHDVDAVEASEAFKSRVSEITSFKVYARVRPFIAEELAEMEGQERRSIVEMLGSKTILLDPKDGWSPKAQFEFDGSLWSIPPSHRLVHTFQDTARQSYATQRDVYNVLAKDLVPHVFEGYNSCILTYGQTGSGKTYTMMGRYDPTASCGGDGEEGIIPRVSNDLFVLLAQRQAAEAAAWRSYHGKSADKDGDDDDDDTANVVSSNNKATKKSSATTAAGPTSSSPPPRPTHYRVEVSFVEIYMERVRDLLDPALRHTRGNEKLHDARIRQDPCSGPFVEGVTKYAVENWSQCCTLLERGSQHRTTCATAVHNQSSRSHAIFQLTVVQEQTIPAKGRYGRPLTRTKAGRINLVDLAGSERGGFQDYVKESSAINTSLLALRRVIDNLTERQNLLMEQLRAEFVAAAGGGGGDGGGAAYERRPLPQVPFRDSVLTWLLSDSIGGNARTTMVATVSPLVKNYGDTLATLQWSSKARNLVTFVKMNDEELVQGGLSTRVGELGSTVQAQRNNLDNLRQTLQQKKETTARLERETATLHKTTTKLQTTRRALLRERAALVLQRAQHHHHTRAQLAACEAALQTMQQEQQQQQQHHGDDHDGDDSGAKTTQQSRAKSGASNSKKTTMASSSSGAAVAAVTAQSTMAQIEQARKAAEAAEAATVTRLRDAEAAAARATAEVAAADAAQDGLDAQLASAQAAKQSICTVLHADELCRAHAAAVAADVDAAQHELQSLRDATATRTQQLADMQRAIDRSRTDEGAAAVRRAAEELPALRKQRDAAVAARQAAQLHYDALHAKHTRLSNKSKSWSCS